MVFDLVAFSICSIPSSIMANRCIYNESLVRRSKIVLDFDVIDNWNNEFSKVNECITHMS
jgi:hypothetical protein